jgi:hypothetical protein
MPAGKKLIMLVASQLDSKHGKTVAQIHAALSIGRTIRGVRYAVAELLKDGRAIRKNGLICAAPADLVVDVREEAGAHPIRTGIPLRECFGDDIEEYAIAKFKLLRDGSTWTGGGAAPAVFLKIHEAA